jgi:aminopeptidase N
MKQLMFYISEENFRTGIQNYFAKYPFKNTQLEDLIGILDEAAEGIDVASWSESWIKGSGFNIIQPKMVVSERDDSKIEKFELHQSLSRYGQNELRSQNIQAVFFNKYFKMEIIEEPIVVEAKEVTELNQFVGKPSPHAFYINYKGWGYGEFLIDDRSLQAFKEGLSKIEDDLTREFIYTTILKMVTEARAPAHVFLEIFRNHIINETNINVISSTLGSLCSILSSYVPSKFFEEESDKIYNFLLKQYLPQAKDAEVKQHVISAIISCSQNDVQKLFLKAWLENKKPFIIIDGKKQEIDANITVSNKHTILRKLSTSLKLNDQGFQEFAEKQLAEDTKDKDLVGRCILAIQAATPDLEVKNKFLDELLGANCDRSIWDQRSIASTLLPVSQKEIVFPLIERFFQDIKVVYDNRLRDERDAVYFAIHPLQFASEELLKRYQELVE